MAKNFLVYGLSGTGKTYSLSTLPLETHKICVIAAENNCLAGLHSGTETVDASLLKNLHILRVKPKNQGLDALITSANDVLTKHPDILAKKVDNNRKNYDRYLKILKGMKNFVSDNGENLGCVDDWDDSYILAIDSMTIICHAIQESVVGGSTFASQPAWFRMQKLLTQLLRHLTEDLECHVILLGHAVRNTNQITGAERIYPSSLGQALNDIIPSMFTEVIYSYKQGKDYFWSVNHSMAVTASRQISADKGIKIPQNYSQFSFN